MEFKHIKKWTRPDSYMGPNYYGYYMGPGMHRDSDALSRSNFQVALESLGGESLEQVELSPGKDDSEHIWQVQVIHDSHWAVGWIEYILVHESAIDKLELLERIYIDLDSYPVLSDDDFSQEEMDEAQETIDNNIDCFRREVLKFLEFKNLEYITRPKRLADLDIFISCVFEESQMYSGLENAWVSDESITRLVESKYPPYNEITDNCFYKLCKAKVG